MEDLRRDTASLALLELNDHVLDLSGLRAHYKADKEGRDRLENLDELINATANFLAESQARSMSGRRGACVAARALLADFSPTLSWKPATTRPTRAPTRCS